MSGSGHPPPQPFRVGFVTGATPDKWARAWRDRTRVPLELVPVEEDAQLDGVRSGELGMTLVRLPADRESVREGLHVIALYDERPVVVAGTDHLVAAADPETGVTLGDLADEQLLLPHASGWTPDALQLDWPPMSVREAIEVAASGTGVVVVPMAVARLHARRDVVTRVVTDLPDTTVALVWRTDHDSDDVQRFVGVVRGRTAHSSRH